METRLQFGTTTISRDATLLSNIAKGHAWFAMLKGGKSVEAIATETGTPKRRVLQLVDLAFLAPDITTAILEGRRPDGLTSDILIKQGFPSDWDAQRNISRAFESPAESSALIPAKIAP